NLFERFVDLLSDLRGKPEAGFVHEKHVWLGSQSAPNGKHLLLPPGELRALAATARAEDREHLIDQFEPRQRPPARLGDAIASLEWGRTDQEVLFDRQGREDESAFGNECDSEDSPLHGAR